MPRYFFDTEDGDDLHQDDEGMDLPDAEAARHAAIGALPDIARDKIHDGDRYALAVRLRDEDGTLVYSAKLDLAGEWHTRRHGPGEPGGAACSVAAETLREDHPLNPGPAQLAVVSPDDERRRAPHPVRTLTPE